jgi:hypothetical protein
MEGCWWNFKLPRARGRLFLANKGLTIGWFIRTTLRRGWLAWRLTFVERLMNDLRDMPLCQLTQVCNEVTLVLLLLRRGLRFHGGMNKTDRNGTRNGTRKATRETRERITSICAVGCQERPRQLSRNQLPLSLLRPSEGHSDRLIPVKLG